MNWLLFANGCIIGMVFVNNFMVWKHFYNDNPGESASDLAYLKEKGFIK